MDFGNVCGIYTLLLLNKYLCSVIGNLKLPHSEQEDAGEGNSGTSTSTVLRQVLNWATLGTGVVMSYFTGAHQYAMQVIDYFLIITANLPTFCRIGAPAIAFLLKASKYQYSFLKGWYVLLLLYVMYESILFSMILLLKNDMTLRKIEQNIWIVNSTLEILFPLSVFTFYQVAMQDRREFIRSILRFFSIQNIQNRVLDFVDELVENG